MEITIITFSDPTSNYKFLHAILKIEKHPARGKKRFFMVFFGKTDSLYLLIMESDIWQKLISTWKEDFYTTFLLQLLQLFTLISGLLTFRPEKLRILILLFVVTTLLDNPYYYSALFNLHQ